MGNVVSTTFTVLVTCVAAFPELSRTSYVTLYIQTLFISTPLFVVSVAFPKIVITGGVVSSIVTTLVTSIAEFPELSETLYVTMYDQTWFTFTLLLSIVTLDPGIISKLSFTVAHGSEYAVPTSRMISFAPTRLITGGVVSTTSTVLVTWVATFPFVSVTL